MESGSCSGEPPAPMREGSGAGGKLQVGSGGSHSIFPEQKGVKEGDRGKEGGLSALKTGHLVSPGTSLKWAGR